MGRPDKKDLRRLGAEVGMGAAEDRQEWRQIVGKVKTHLGFV